MIMVSLFINYAGMQFEPGVPRNIGSQWDFQQLHHMTYLKSCAHMNSEKIISKAVVKKLALTRQTSACLPQRGITGNCNELLISSQHLTPIQGESDNAE